MKNNVLSMFKVNNKSTRLLCYLHCYGNFIDSFRDMGIENSVKHLQWNFFTKLVNRQKLKVSTGF